MPDPFPIPKTLWFLLLTGMGHGVRESCRFDEKKVRKRAVRRFVKLEGR